MSNNSDDDLNQVVLAGRVVRDSELKRNPSGSATLIFTVAVKRTIRRSNLPYPFWSIVDMVAFDKDAERWSYELLRNVRVNVRGELWTDSWEKDGRKMSRLSVTARFVQVLGTVRPGDDELESIAKLTGGY